MEQPESWLSKPGVSQHPFLSDKTWVNKSGRQLGKMKLQQPTKCLLSCPQGFPLTQHVKYLRVESVQPHCSSVRGAEPGQNILITLSCVPLFGKTKQMEDKKDPLVYTCPKIPFTVSRHKISIFIKVSSTSQDTQLLQWCDITMKWGVS